jgi:hypothetical protein
MFHSKMKQRVMLSAQVVSGVGSKADSASAVGDRIDGGE